MRFPDSLCQLSTINIDLVKIYVNHRESTFKRMSSFLSVFKQADLLVFCGGFFDANPEDGFCS